jgi:hypothetical protein
MKPFEVPLGRSVSSGKEVRLIVEPRGVLVCEALSGMGKSVISKRVAVEAYKHKRPVIIFDPMSEYFTIQYANFDSKTYMGGIGSMKIIKDFGFPVYKFDSIDLSGIGLSTSGVTMLLNIVHDPILRGFHGNIPERIFQIICDLPRNAEGREMFYERYHVDFREVMNAQSWEALKFWFSMALRGRMFYDPSDPGRMNNIENISREVKRGECVVFDLGLRGSEAGLFKVQLNCGIVLKELRRVIEDLNPIIIFEEADKLAPNSNITGEMPPSSMQIFDLCVKLQKLQVFVIAVTQNENMILPSLSENCHQRILGLLNEGSRNFHYVERLNIDPYYNKRRFVLVRHGRVVSAFEPFEPPCLDFNHLRDVRDLLYV